MGEACWRVSCIACCSSWQPQAWGVPSTLLYCSRQVQQLKRQAMRFSAALAPTLLSSAMRPHFEACSACSFAVAQQDPVVAAPAVQQGATQASPWHILGQHTKHAKPAEAAASMWVLLSMLVCCEAAHGLQAPLGLVTPTPRPAGHQTCTRALQDRQSLWGAPPFGDSSPRVPRAGRLPDALAGSVGAAA